MYAKIMAFANNVFRVTDLMRKVSVKSVIQIGVNNATITATNAKIA